MKTTQILSTAKEYNAAILTNEMIEILDSIKTEYRAKAPLLVDIKESLGKIERMLLKGEDAQLHITNTDRLIKSIATQSGNDTPSKSNLYRPAIDLINDQLNELVQSYKAPELTTTNNRVPLRKINNKFYHA